MKIIYIFALSFFSPVFLSAQFQQIIDFESIELELDTFLNGSDGVTEFCLPQDDSGNCLFEFPVEFIPDFGGLWIGGWAMSSVLDTIDGNFTNLYGAAAGRGFEQSATYAVGQQDAFIRPDVNNQLANGAIFRSFYVTNTTYAARVIRDGNMFADPFGGDTGDDPDFFSLTIKGYVDGQPSGDSTVFYLADYRFADNEQDYIIEDWTQVELVDWPPIVDSISFHMASSDVDSLDRINTPLFFAIDEMSFDLLSSVEEITPDWAPTAFPNPSPTGLIELRWPAQFDWHQRTSWYVHDALGRPVLRGDTRPDTLDLSTQPKGIYFLVMELNGERHSLRLVRH